MARIGSCVILGVVLFVAAQYPVGLVKAENVGQDRAVEYVSSYRWTSTVIDEHGNLGSAHGRKSRWLAVIVTSILKS
jgi:hypothetical protein